MDYHVFNLYKHLCFYLHGFYVHVSSEKSSVLSLNDYRKKWIWKKSPTTASRRTIAKAMIVMTLQRTLILSAFLFAKYLIDVTYVLKEQQLLSKFAMTNSKLFHMFQHTMLQNCITSVCECICH